MIEELNYNIEELKQKHELLLNSLNIEQRRIYNDVIDTIDRNTYEHFFIYGYGETGKTYLYKIIISNLRSRGKIVLVIAPSGIAALLLSGGRTAHSRFKIPLNINECSTC